MRNEISFNQTPLPELLEKLANAGSGLSAFWAQTARALRADGAIPVDRLLYEQLEGLPIGEAPKIVLKNLAASLGRYDLEGQLRSLKLAEVGLDRVISGLEREKSGRCRSLTAFGAGLGLAAAVLLF